MAAIMSQSRRNSDTIILVIDPVAGRVITSRRLEGEALAPINPGTYWTLENDRRTGLVQIQIWHARLRDPLVRR